MDLGVVVLLILLTVIGLWALANLVACLVQLFQLLSSIRLNK